MSTLHICPHIFTLFYEICFFSLSLIDMFSFICLVSSVVFLIMCY